MLDVPLNTPLTLDPKGRITLPSRLKGQLDHVGTSALIFIAHNGHLRAYTKADFRKHVEGPLVGLDSFDPEVERKQRMRLGFAVEISIDAQGRFLVPLNLRQMAALERDVVLISLAERFELWDAKRLDAWVSGQLLAGGVGA